MAGQCLSNSEAMNFSLMCSHFEGKDFLIFYPSIEFGTTHITILDIDLGNVNLNGGLNLGDVLDLDVDADAGNVVLSIGKDGSIVNLDTGNPFFYLFFFFLRGKGGGTESHFNQTFP